MKNNTNMSLSWRSIRGRNAMEDGGQAGSNSCDDYLQVASSDLPAALAFSDGPANSEV